MQMQCLLTVPPWIINYVPWLLMIVERTARCFSKLMVFPFTKGRLQGKSHLSKSRKGLDPTNWCLLLTSENGLWLSSSERRGWASQLMRTSYATWCVTQTLLRESLTEEAAAASALIEEHTKPSFSNSKSLSEQHPLTADFPAALDTASTSSQLSSSQICLTSEQISKIDSVFAKDLSQEIEPRKKRVVALMKADNMHIKKILDRIGYLCRRRPSIDPKDLPEETASQRTVAYVHTVPEKTTVDHWIRQGRVGWGRNWCYPASSQGPW